MKNLFLTLLFVGGVAALTSCKKDYTCDCKGSGDDSDWTFSFPINDAKKKDAESACDAANATYNMFGASCTLNSK